MVTYLWVHKLVCTYNKKMIPIQGYKVYAEINIYLQNMRLQMKKDTKIKH